MNNPAHDLLAKFDALSARLEKAQAALGEVVFGQDRVIEETLITILCGGHGLLVGTPGLAKTRLVTSVGTVLGLSGKRVQFTPDLMPSDILGIEVLDESPDGKRSFRFIEGPVFCQLLMADEINRASPRTQSALLEAMQERQVTIAGERRALPAPFHVLATQNPIEQEGTYPLPEAQLDRFLLQINVDQPPYEAEREMLKATTFTSNPQPSQVLGAEELQEAQDLVRAMPIGDNLIDKVLQLVRMARPGGQFAEHLRWGPGPRASQAFSLALRARALLRGAPAPETEDLIALAQPILRHRMALNFSARAEGLTIDALIDRMVEASL
ncbi:MoxR family ATPase [Parvularcula sp. ZS-1/3]|uniref:MoxR family ATPase n=1 Tax=Parvularcula mediterranea TaxID=2732508 RepID=A0A7Y3RJB6_9PROT|nr:MoxR family ATPase [Parvularcula mediterranea]NNU15134.1 MoxR family ATPase [Parvularcula mediterranea]